MLGAVWQHTLPPPPPPLLCSLYPGDNVDREVFCFVQADKKKQVFYTLRVCRSDAKKVGKRVVAAKKKAEQEAEKAKAAVA